MKLSALTTDNSLDILCEMTPYITSIASDEELSAEIRRKIDPENAKTKAALYLEGVKKINALVPLLLKSHREDIYGILAALNGKDAEEIGRQNVLLTGMQIREAVKDKELIAFFKSWLGPDSGE